MNSTYMMNEVKKALLSEDKIQINNLFTGEKTLTFKYGKEDLKLNYSLTKYQVTTLLRMSLFHLTQYIEKKTLTEEKNYNFRLIIISLLHIAKDLEPENEEFLKECTNSIFKNPLVLTNFLPVYKKKDFIKKMFTDTFLELCITLHSLRKESLCIDTINPYKEKLIAQLKSTVEKCKTKDKIKQYVKTEFFELLQLNIPAMINLLKVIMELPVNRFLSSDKTCLSIWGVTVPKLLEACLQGNSISHRSIFPLDVDLFKKLCSYLVDLKVSKVDIGLWETSLCKYLQRFPHNIGNLDKRIFVLLIRNRITSTTIDLISHLINRNPVVIPQLIKFTKKDETIMRKNDMIFRLLGSNLTYKWDKEFLFKLYELHKKEIITYLIEPAGKHSWIQENARAVIYLIEANFDTETCQQICNTMLVNGDKLNKVDIEYVQLLETLFKKVKSSRDFIQVLVHLLASTLKLCKNKSSLSKNTGKLEFLCVTLIQTIESLKIKEKNLIFEELNKNHSWPQFVRFSLTQGLKSTEEENSLDNALLLKALIAACTVAYIENGSDEYVKTIFGLATTHSEYADIMLSTTNIKRYLVELILVLIRKNKSTMLSNHIPFYLAAYKATLSESDQILLLIIKQYENYNVDLNKYRPFLWGDTAASHYSVKEDPNTALFRQPKTSQILDLFVPDIVNNTITNFPVKRSLKEESLCAPENVYDPTFYLSVLCEVLAENNPVAYHKVTHSGALALMLIACCSNCDQIRLAAFTDISRFYFHLEHLDVRRSNERLLWIRFIDALRNGIVELETSMKEVRLNGFMATFLARASIVGTQPLHPLYCPLHKFFMAKPAFKLNTIPEFKRLFHSTEVEYEAHRNWILEVIRDGFKSESDIQIAINCSIFNVLLSFYVCSLSDKTTRKFMLEIISSIAKIPKSGVLLVNHYGIMPWLDAITDLLETSDSDFVPLLIDITKNFLDSFLAKKVTDKFRLFALMHVFVTLKSSMINKTVTVSCFTTYIDSLETILGFKDLYLSEKHMKDLLELYKQLFGYMEEFEDLLEYGSEFALHECDDQKEKVSAARKSFRKLILKWHSCKKNLSKNKGVIIYPDGSVCRIPSNTK